MMGVGGYAGDGTVGNGRVRGPHAAPPATAAARLDHARIRTIGPPGFAMPPAVYAKLDSMRQLMAGIAIGWLAPIAAGALVVSAPVGASQGTPRDVVLRPGDLAPDFSLPGSDGRTYRLADYRGVRPVVVAWFPRTFTKE